MLLHASCVSIEGRGVLLVGDSGSGKSALACELMMVGAALVADDQVCLVSERGTLVASCPPSIAGKIELRGFGVVSAHRHEASVPVMLAVRLQEQFPERFPETSCVLELLGHRVPYVLASSADRHLPAKLMIYMQSRQMDTQCSQYTLHPPFNRPKTA